MKMYTKMNNKKFVNYSQFNNNFPNDNNSSNNKKTDINFFVPLKNTKHKMKNYSIDWNKNGSRWFVFILISLKCFIFPVYTIDPSTSSSSSMSPSSLPVTSAVTSLLEAANNAGSSSSSGGGGGIIESGIGVKTLLNGESRMVTDCSSVASIFENRGINPAEIPKKPLYDQPSRYCNTSGSGKGSCCTLSMEGRLANSLKQQFDKSNRDSIGKLSSIFSTRALKFNEFFNQLLSESKREFHEMFKRTYGVIYEENAYVFSDLFSELEKYYTRGKVDLSEAMDSFFNTLYQKMFTVLNSQYELNDKYLECVSEHMKELKPFGDVPDKLSLQIKRSFVATRTYAQALFTAADVVKKVMNIRPSENCTAELMKMQQCNFCKGHSEKPCYNYCVDVMKGCLYHYRELDTEWDSFVAIMDKVAERLIGSFNIVVVVEPINIKISEAIMNFQETGQVIATRVFQGCGKPNLKRPKREINRFNYKNKFFEGSQLKTIDINTEESDIKNQNNSNNKNDDDILDIDAGLENEVVLNINNFNVNNDDNNNNNNDNSNYYNKAKVKEFRLKRAIQEISDRNSDEEYKTNVNNSRKINGEEISSDIQADQQHRYNPNRNGNRNNRNLKKNNRRKQYNRNNEDDEDEGGQEPILDKLLRDIRQKVKDSKKFWSNLAYHACNNENIAAESKGDMPCWNGKTVDKYLYSVSNSPSYNADFSTSVSIVGSRNVANQLYYLKATINKLRNAYTGNDVEWSDQDEPYYGSGSGSGEGIDDDEENGSGSGAFDPDAELERIVPTHHHHNVDKTQIHRVHTTQNISETTISNTGNNNINTGTSNSGTSKTSTSLSSLPIDDYSEKPTSKVSRASRMSLRQAITSYLFPIYVAWFGGIISDLL